MLKVDMSSGAVTTRLKRVSQLRRLCLSLATAKILCAEPRKTEVKNAAIISKAPDISKYDKRENK